MGEEQVLNKIKEVQKHILEELTTLRYGDSSDITFSERLSDKIVLFLGSWKFISLQLLFLVGWIGFNIIAALKFDSYPYILLNLCLSFQAALFQAVILMAQNRSEQKDRRRAMDAYRSISNIENMIEELVGHIQIVRKNGHQEKN